MNTKKNNILITILIIFLSFLLSAITKQNILGLIILLFGLLNGWYAALDKWYNYIFGSIFSILNAYVSYKVNLYGIFYLSIVLYFPIQIYGLINWYLKKEKNNNMNVRSFNKKTSISIILSCLLGSIIFSFVLSKIPNQKLALLDAASNIINICALTLLSLRFKESWWILLGNNIIDLIIWIINFINNKPNSFIMLIISIGYLILNIIGIIKWQCKKKESTN